jgi:ABC-type bacteriocin/lantibiotic exporter with double-glycine peptidase domain
MQFFYQRYAGDIQNRIYLNDKIAVLLSGPLSTNFIGMFLIIFYAVLMFQYDVFLTVVSVSFALINFLALRFVSKKRTVLNQVLQVEQGKLIGNSMSGLQLIETIKASGSEADFFSKWAGYYAKVFRSQEEMDFSTLLLSAVPLTLALFNNIAILTFGSLRILGGLLTIGLLSAYQMLMRNFSQPVNSMVDLGGQIQEIRGDLDRLDDVLNNKEDEQIVRIEEAGAVSDNPKLEGCLELKNVTFGYSAVSAPVIEGFSISLKPGERIALVGSSGCGKSTVARLIAGLYQPWEGEILFDGKSRIGYPKEIMNNSLAIVDQDIFLFRGTVRDNITMWDTTIDSGSMILAAKDAAIHNEISSREKGYDGIVEEGGVNFSGGQCQRIEIARALAINPSILILDEAMSALDPAIEKTIDNNIRRRGCTALIIAHRLSTIRDCSQIIVIEKGKIVESGTHEELIKAKGHYHKLITAG